MAKGWKCPRCSTMNDEAAYNCSNCRLIRGSVVVPDAPMAPRLPSAPALDPVAQGPVSEAEPNAFSGVEAAPPGVDSSAWATGEAVVAAAKPPLWRRIPLTWLLTFVLIAGGGIAGLIFNAARSGTGEINKAGDLKITDLRVGDCFDLKDPAADLIEEVKAAPCTQEHEYEMFHIGSMPAGAYPTDEAFTAYVEDNCLPEFATFVGISYEESELDVFWVAPSPDSWKEGDNAVQCAVYHPRIHRLTESLKGSAR